MLPFSAHARRRMSVTALGTLSTSVTVGQSSDSTTYWVRGFVATTSIEYGETGAVVGSLAATALGTATVVGVYWRSQISGTGTGSVYVEVTGNQAAGQVRTLSVAGTDQGTVGVPVYNSSTNTTTFKFGAAKTNPFGTTGSKAIVIT